MQILQPYIMFYRIKHVQMELMYNGNQAGAKKLSWFLLNNSISKMKTCIKRTVFRNFFDFVLAGFIGLKKKKFVSKLHISLNFFGGVGRGAAAPSVLPPTRIYHCLPLIPILSVICKFV